MYSDESWNDQLERSEELYLFDKCAEVFTSIKDKLNTTNKQSAKMTSNHVKKNLLKLTKKDVLPKSLDNDSDVYNFYVVLYDYGGDYASMTSKLIAWHTKSKYSHAAFSLDTMMDTCMGMTSRNKKIDDAPDLYLEHPEKYRRLIYNKKQIYLRQYDVYKLQLNKDQYMLARRIFNTLLENKVQMSYDVATIMSWAQDEFNKLIHKEVFTKRLSSDIITDLYDGFVSLSRSNICSSMTCEVIRNIRPDLNSNIDSLINNTIDKHSINPADLLRIKGMKPYFVVPSTSDLYHITNRLKTPITN